MELGKKDDIIRTYCNRCKTEINQRILMTIDSEAHDFIDQDMAMDGGVHGYYTDSADSFQIIECLGCNLKSFRQMRWFSEWQDFDNPGIEEKIFPPPEKNTRCVKEYLEMPFLIEEMYSQSIKAFNQSLWILCAVGIRSMVEGVCKQKGITDGIKNSTGKKRQEKSKGQKSLYEKIEKIYEIGIITGQQKVSLHELRYLGNAAIHELENPSIEDLDIGLDIIENMLQNIYDIPSKSQILINRRIKGNTKSV